MGTIVLSPQDCFVSSPNGRNYCFSSMANTSNRKSFLARTPFLSDAMDCVRTHPSGESPPGNGLLPIPQPHSQARALLRKSSPSEFSSSVHTTLPRRSTTAFVTSKSKLSRSGSPPLSDKDRLHLIEGRLPLKALQGNIPGGAAQLPLRVAKKSAEKCGSRRNTPDKCGEKVKEHFEGREGLKTSVKRFFAEVAIKNQLNQRCRSRGSLEKSRSGKDFGDSCKQPGIPVVTILQRPKNEEAAAELIAKYFKKSDEKSLLSVNDEAPSMLEKHDGVVTGSETESSSSGVAYSEGSNKSTCGSSDSVCMLFDVPLADTKKDVEGPSVDLATEPHLGIQKLSNVTKATVKSPSLGSGCDDVTLWERWAGPCYINSPPPSALPLPCFSKKQGHAKCGPLVSSPLFKETGSDKASTVMTPTSTVPSSCLGHQDLTTEFDTFASATKDLKRILNLQFGFTQDLKLQGGRKMGF